MAMAGLHEMTPKHWAFFMRRLRESSVYARHQAYQGSNDHITFAHH
jgi:hypothetical protein